MARDTFQSPDVSPFRRTAGYQQRTMSQTQGLGPRRWDLALIEFPQPDGLWQSLRTPLKFIQAGMLSLSVMAEYSSRKKKALRHHSHLLKLFPGLSFKNGSGWHFQSILGLLGYLNYRPPADYLFWVFSSICSCRLASCGLNPYLIGELLLKVKGRTKTC